MTLGFSPPVTTDLWVLLAAISALKQASGKRMAARHQVTFPHSEIASEPNLVSEVILT